jgi:hypothetical protein
MSMPKPAAIRGRLGEALGTSSFPGAHFGLHPVGPELGRLLPGRPLSHRSDRIEWLVYGLPVPHTQ